MTLADLLAYAREKYQITEQFKWEAFPRFSVLSDPETGKWAALLMRQWDEDSGAEIELCDVKCGATILSGISADYITKPFRMHGVNWAGIRFSGQAKPEVILPLFDRAMKAAHQPGYTIVLDDQPYKSVSSVYQETLLPHPGAVPAKKRELIPDRIRKMRRLCDEGTGLYFTDERKLFFMQGMFMRDYEDNQPWDGRIDTYYASYQALDTKQLRGYFTWRTAVRKGSIQPANDCFVGIYLNELLNLIGADFPQDSLQKMQEFEKGYLKTGCSDEWFVKRLHRWMLEFAIIHGIHPEEARQYADPDMLTRDGAMAVLRSPEGHTDDEVYSALLLIAKEKLMFSTVMLKSPQEGKALFAKAWKAGCAGKGFGGKNLFEQCFGRMAPFPWRPLANTLYWERRKLNGVKYQLNACRVYVCSNNTWQVCSYETLFFDRGRFFGFLHETDRQLRIYLKAGHPLKEKPSEAWAKPFVGAVIAQDRKEKEEAAKPKVVLNLAGLEQIRRDAMKTRDSLLTEEEKQEMDEMAETPEAVCPEIEPEAISVLPLDKIQFDILRTLLAGNPADGIIRENRLLPSVVADGINEAFFEEIGDSVIEENDGSLALIEDYEDDVRRLLGG